MTFLLDTDTCVHWLRGNPIVQSRFAAVGPDTMTVSTITLAELRYGAECSARPDANHQAIDDFTSGVAILGVDPDVARSFGDIKAQLRIQGNLLEDFDIFCHGTGAWSHPRDGQPRPLRPDRGPGSRRLAAAVRQE